MSHYTAFPRCLRIIAGLCATLLMSLATAATPASAPEGWWNALTRDDAGAVQTMLRRHTDPNVTDPTGLPSLMFAIRAQSWKAYDVLRRAPRIRIEAVNRLDETPLMYLCVLGETERAKALIAAGAQVNRLGWTPLHYAASRGRLDTMRMLLSHHAIVNAPGPDGTTPLMMAALSGDEDAVRLLLQRGADPTMFNLKHQAAADWARNNQHDRLAAKLDALVADAVARRSGKHIEPQQPKAADAAQAEANDNSSFSRYFDLDRFEDTPVGQ